MTELELCDFMSGVVVMIEQGEFEALKALLRARIVELSQNTGDTRIDYRSVILDKEE